MSNIERKKEIDELRELGMSYQKIGNKFGLSWQRIQQIHRNLRKPNIDPINHKILTKKKRKAVGIGDYKVDSSRGGREFLNELVRSRDNFICQICKKVWSENMRRFDVHHMDEEMDGKNRFRGILSYNRENLNKLVTLCHKCHMNLDVTVKRMRNKSSPLNMGGHVIHR